MSLPQANPNESPYRAPEGEQIPSICDRESQRLQVIKQITHNANSATATYESIKARYDEQVLVLERLQSELQVAKSLMESWKDLAASPDLDTQQLQALLQPILRYPDDHLRLIFEQYVADSKRPFSAAVTLSHVCQRWRDVEISTPTLWKRVRFMEVKNGEVLKSKAEAFLERVGRVPAEIIIDVYSTHRRPDTAINSIMPFGLIYAAPRISAVEIRVSFDHDNPSLIFDGIYHFPHGEVESLRIHLQDRVPEPFLPSRFISKFLGVRMLNLQGFTFELPISPTLSLVLTNIIQLDLESVDHLDMTQLLPLMRNNLQKLRVKKCKLVPSSEPHTKLYVMQLLSSLCVECNGFPWNQIQCPKLAHLVVPDRTSGLEGESFWDFCSTTESITSVNINVDRDDLEQFTRLARSALRLRTLQIHYPTNRIIASGLLKHDRLDRPPFPDLLHLFLVKVHQGFRVATLDSLIQHRWFPRGHPESRVDPGVANALKRLEITAEEEPTDWKQSRYLPTHFVKMEGDISSGQPYRFVGKGI